jgi:hypothetical protein
MRGIELRLVILCVNVLTLSGFQSIEVTATPPAGSRGYDADSPDADHFEVAIEMAEEGNIDGALTSFRACVRFSPSPEAFSNLGMALLEPELTSKEKFPELNTFELSLGKALLETEAVLAFEKALELNPKHQQSKEQLLMLKPPLIAAPEFIKALVEHLGDSSLSFSAAQLNAIEQFGASYIESNLKGSPSDSAQGVEDEEEYDSNEDLEQAVRGFNFGHAGRMCQAGELTGTEAIDGVPLLNWMSLYVKRYDELLDPLAMCLIENDAVTDRHTIGE